MIAKLADALLGRVYHPVTAVVSMDTEGKVLGVILFDTLFGPEEFPTAPGAAQLAVLCGHPDGRLTLCEEERNNLRRIEAAMALPIRAYICGEDVGCFEVDNTL